MRSGDGLILRVRQRGGAFGIAQVAAIAEASQRFGNGLIDITRRGALQLRGVEEAGYAPVLERLDAHGLLDRDSDSEAARNVVVDPMMGMDGADVARAILRELEERLVSGALAGVLPAKFGFAVDTARAPVLREVPADIRIETAADGGLIVVPDGAGRGFRVEPGEAVEAMISAARVFAAHPQVMAGEVRRMRPLIVASGEEDFLARFGRLLAERAAPGAALLPGIVMRDDVVAGICIGWPFGQIEARDLARLIAEAEGASELRLTPWRSVFLPNVASGIFERIAGMGLVTRADDPRLRIDVCVGAPGCASAEAETRQLARLLAATPDLADKLAGDAVLHVSGCAKGCARSTPADRTLTGRAGRFDLVIDGRPGDAAILHDIAPDAVAEALRRSFPAPQ
jgi:precorrin-3B synthase